METVITQDLKTRLQENLAAREASGAEGNATAQPSGTEPRKRGRPRKNPDTAGLVTPQQGQDAPRPSGLSQSPNIGILFVVKMTFDKIGEAFGKSPNPAIQEAASGIKLSDDEAYQYSLAWTHILDVYAPAMDEKTLVIVNVALQSVGLLVTRWMIIEQIKQINEAEAKKAAQPAQTSTQAATPQQGAQ